MELSSGKYYKVGKIGEQSISIKLVCLGIIPGKVIHIVRKAAFGGAYYINCDDKRLAISCKQLESLGLSEVVLEESKVV